MKRKIIAVLAPFFILAGCGNVDGDVSSSKKTISTSAETSAAADISEVSGEVSYDSDISEEEQHSEESGEDASESEESSQAVTEETTSLKASEKTTSKKTEGTASTTAVEITENVYEPAETTTPAPTTVAATTTTPKPTTTTTTTTTTAEPTTTTTTTTSETTIKTEPVTEEKVMKINVNGTEYTAHFYDTKAAEEFRAMLPMTLDMSELNGNEKYIYLDTSFSTASENVGHINKGEIMLFGADCVVLFYDSFSTPYSYTRLGYIDDPDGLESVVGSGSATVTFSAD